jgi:hypothetical protein
VNKVILELIGGSAGPEKRRKKPTGASLAELAGGWSEKEAREFEESVQVFEKIDKGIPSGKALSARSGIKAEQDFDGACILARKRKKSVFSRGIRGRKPTLVTQKER